MKSEKLSAGLSQGLIIIGIILGLSVASFVSAQESEDGNKHTNHSDYEDDVVGPKKPEDAGSDEGGNTAIYVGVGIIVGMLVAGGAIAIWINICVKNRRNSTYHT